MKRGRLRTADIHALPDADASGDLVTIDQVRHFLDDPPAALLEARRVLNPNGTLVIADFAPHELEELRSAHAHRRLGLSAEQMAGFLARAGFSLKQHKVLPPPWLKSGPGLTVSLWLAQAQAQLSPSYAKVKVA